MMKGLILKKLVDTSWDFNLSIFKLPVNPSGISRSVLHTRLSYFDSILNETSRINFKIKILITAWYHIKFLHLVYLNLLRIRVVICKLEIVKSNPFKNIRSYNMRYAVLFYNLILFYNFSRNNLYTVSIQINNSRHGIQQFDTREIYL